MTSLNMKLYAINDKFKECELPLENRYIHRILEVYKNDPHHNYFWLSAESMDMDDIEIIINTPANILTAEQIMCNNLEEYNGRYGKKC